MEQIKDSNKSYSIIAAILFIDIRKLYIYKECYSMDDSMRINTNINPEKICKYELNSERLERLRENIKKLERVMAESFNIQTTKLSAEMLNASIQNSFVKISSTFEQYDYTGMLKDIQYIFHDIAEKTSIGQLETIQNIDFGKLFKAPFYQEKYGEAGNIAFEYLCQKLIRTYKGCGNYGGRWKRCLIKAEKVLEIPL